MSDAKLCNINVLAIYRGDIVLSKEQSPTSWILRKLTRSQWSHVGIYDGFGKVISAVPFKGVIYKNYGEMFEKCSNVGVYRVKDMTKQRADKVIEFCEKHRDTKYDFMQAAVLGWRILTDGLKTNTGDPNPDNFVCSELVAEAFASIGINFGKIPDNVLPSTIEKSHLVRRVI